MCDIVPSSEFLEVAKEGIGPLVGAVFTALFVRNNSKKSELEKVKAGKFSELADQLLNEGKLSYQEYYRCNNFLKIAKLADEHLHSKQVFNSSDSQSDDKVIDFDWLIRFFDAVGTVSNIDMQKVWARVLAGESRGRGQFSLRTIELLHDLSPVEAETFKNAASLIMNDGSYRPAIVCTTENIPDVNSFYGISADEIEVLTDCGILIGTRSELALFDGVDDYHMFDNGDTALLLSPKNDDGARMSLYLYPLSTAATQLLAAIDVSPDEDYLLDFGKMLLACYGIDVSVSARRILCINNDEFELDGTDILSGYDYAAQGLEDEVTAVLNGKYGKNTSVRRPPSIPTKE